MPNMMEHARGIAHQIAASRDRVRALTNHWATDGSHREELLRVILRERLPARCRVESGFVLTPSRQSRQVDLLIVDTAKPIVSRGADGTVFVTPDSVLAMIEVKSKLEGRKAYINALTQLADSATLCSQHPIWTGLFVHDADQRMNDLDGPDDIILDSLNAVARSHGVKIGSVSVGSHLFIRFWENSSLQASGICHGPAWHSYFMTDLAPAYFVGNVVAQLSDLPEEYSTVWFPIPDGKETKRRWYAAVHSPPVLFPEFEESALATGTHRLLARAAKWKKH